MIRQTDLAELRPAQRAELIYTQARSELSGRLWRAALGSADEADEVGATPHGSPPRDLAGLLSVLAGEHHSVHADNGPISLAPPLNAAPAALPMPTSMEMPATSTGLSLGVNAGLGSAIEKAAARTSIPAPALAAIINAEAAKRPDGTWQTLSRNPRSSAAGLGQFLSGTWLGEAQRRGTWLNDTARERGWLTEAGRVDPAARSQLLALRYDPVASINATADYARANLDRLRKAGIPVEGDTGAVARAAYLGHHLGAGDAIRFFKGGLDTKRAQVLLNAQVGSSAASVRIARAGNAAEAHRSWLLDYVGNRVQPQRFASVQHTA